MSEMPSETGDLIATILQLQKINSDLEIELNEKKNELNRTLELLIANAEENNRLKHELKQKKVQLVARDNIISDQAKIISDQAKVIFDKGYELSQSKDIISDQAKVISDQAKVISDQAKEIEHLKRDKQEEVNHHSEKRRRCKKFNSRHSESSQI